jgi:hypothetical protein
MESPTCLKHAVLWFCCEKNMKSPSNQSSHRAEKTSGNARPVSCVLILEARIFTAWLYQATLWTTLSHTPRNKKNVFCSTLHTFLTSHSVAKKKLQGHCMSCLICGASLAQGQPELAGGHWTTQDWSGGCDLNWQCLVKPRLCHGPAGRHHSNMIYIYIYEYMCMCIHMEYPRLHMAYGILQTTYHFSEHRLPKQNCHKFAICSIHTRCICVFLMALIWLVKIWYHKMDGLRSIPVPQFIPVLVESDIRFAYKYHHISTIPYSKQPWYHCSMISLFSWKYGMVLWLLLKMVVGLKTAHFGWTNDSEIREQIINQPSFIRYILSTYIPICLRIKAP